jgi:uncharacterized protein YigA (DUF484 family)
MGFAEIAVAFVVIGLPTMAVFALVSRMFRHREKKMELEAQIASASAKAGRNEQLEHRVRVLERIVTDKGVVVADEIDRLRDENVN